MPDKHDLVESTLQSLAARRWPGAAQNPELENKLMQTFDHQKTKNVLFRHPLIAACLAVLVLGSFGFAAAGGVEVVKSWFVTVEVDGIVLEDEMFEGPVDVTITTDENGNQTVILTDADGNPLEGEATVTTTIVEGDSCTLSLQGTPDDSAKDDD